MAETGVQYNTYKYVAPHHDTKASAKSKDLRKWREVPFCKKSDFTS
jgi:hypothetical protein